MEAVETTPPATPDVFADVVAEIDRAQSLGIGGDTESFDRTNTKNDWVGFIAAYSGRAVDRCPRNEREGQTFRENMVKVAALAIQAVQAHDAGHC